MVNEYGMQCGLGWNKDGRNPLGLPTREKRVFSKGTSYATLRRQLDAP